jgi:signal transduction histidine kinase
VNGVSGRALGTLFKRDGTDTFSVDEVSAALGIDVDALTEPSAKVPWETFVRIMDHLAAKLGGPEQFRPFVEARLPDGSLTAFHRIVRVLASPRDAYALGARWIGPSLFPMIDAEFSERADGLLIQRLTLQPGLRDCPALFHGLHGALTVLPRAWGHGVSEVELELAPGVATYKIRPSPARRGLYARVVRALGTRLAFPAMLRELEAQQRAIDTSYRELSEAHARISAQARDLERVDSIGRELSKDVDLDRVLDALVGIVRQDLAFRGAEIWLAEVSGTPGESLQSSTAGFRRIRSEGTCGECNRLRYPLETAGRPLGELVVHLRPEEEAGNSIQILSLLIPWIALAIDNALTYGRLELHARQLEDRVEERTARLVAANRDLVHEMDERKRAHDALLQSEAQLQASERLASIGTLAAGIAHEINNPIGSILAAAQLARIQSQEQGTSEQVASALDDIVSEAKRCGSIVRSVLQFAREERTDKWPCALQDLVTRSIQLTTGFAARRSARVESKLREISPIVNGNPIQLEQAIIHLIRNALESGAKCLEVRVEHSPGSRMATIEIIDDGSGIAENERKRVLEPFYTTRRPDGGTGLGLSAAHGIAVEHGGTLSIESNTPRGSRVRLTLPTASPDTATAGTGSPTRPPNDGPRPT